MTDDDAEPFNDVVYDDVVGDDPPLAMWDSYKDASIEEKEFRQEMERLIEEEKKMRNPITQRTIKEQRRTLTFGIATSLRR